MSSKTPLRGKRNIFLSYSHDDQEFALRLSKILMKSGFLVFDPANETVPDEKWSDKIVREMRKSAGLVFVIPAREGAGKNALAELGMARALDKNIVAVMPDSSRAWNASFARVLSDSAVVDASKLRDDALANALAMAG